MRIGKRLFEVGNGQYEMFWYAQSVDFIYWERNLEIRFWCYEQWGPSGYHQPVIWDERSDGMFIFDDEDKLTMFRLRWG